MDLPQSFLVSVIVPNYNYADFLPETLDSVLAQTYAHWECIIVDDGSTDNSAEIIQRYATKDDRFRYVFQENQGPSAAKNTGIKLARGKYLQFLDADDLMESQKIKKQAFYLDAHPNTDLIYSNVEYFSNKNPSLKSRSYDMLNVEWVPEFSGNGLEILELLLQKNIMVTNAPLIRREAVDDVGAFDEELKAFEDWHYWIKLSVANKNFFFDGRDETLAKVRLHEKSLTKKDKQMLDSEVMMRKKIPVLLTNYITSPCLLKKYLDLNTQRLLARVGQAGFKQVYQGSIRLGLYQLIRAIWHTGNIFFYLKNGAYWLKERSKRMNS